MVVLLLPRTVLVLLGLLLLLLVVPLLLLLLWLLWPLLLQLVSGSCPSNTVGGADAATVRRNAKDQNSEALRHCRAVMEASLVLVLVTALVLMEENSGLAWAVP